MHLIQQHNIEVNCSKQQLGHEFKNDLSALLELEFYPKLQRLLYEYDDVDTILSIEELPIELNNLDVKNWKPEFISQSMLQIETFLKEHLPQKNKVERETLIEKLGWRMSKKEHIQELVINFIKSGVLKSNVQTTSLQELYNDIEINSSFVKRMKDALKGEIKAVLRWSLNLPQHLKFEFLGTDGITHDFDFVVKGADRSHQLNDFLEFLYWIGYFNEGSTMLDERFMKPIKSIAKQYYNIEGSYVDKLLYKDDKNENSLIKSTIKDKEENTVFKQETSLFIDNAGLVLLHPFLLKLFSELGYQEKGIWKDTLSQHRAILILQYLVGFNDAVFENQLLLNKLMCGINLTDTVHTKFEITNEEKELSQHLIQSVIEHWTILKNTSVVGLQESFIQRAGKLILNDNGLYELTIENKSYDLLLDQLPWGIGMIKTPWMESFLTCNWR